MQRRANSVQNRYEKENVKKSTFDINVHETNIPTQETEEQKSKLHFWVISQCNFVTVVSHYTAQRHSSEVHNILSLRELLMPKGTEV
jgi:hypothetical protein